MIYLYLFGTCFHFIYVFMIIGNKLIHSYNHDFNYHPNLQHRTIHSTIYSDDWLVNKKKYLQQYTKRQKKLE